MRITCPNCGAQYEIDAALIPAAGREVQCSACATAWFQEGQARKAGQGAQARTLRRPSDTPSAAAKPEAQAGSVAAKARVGAPSPVVRSDDDDDAEPARGAQQDGGAAGEGSGSRPEPAPGASVPRPAASVNDEDDDHAPAPARPRPATDERTLEILRQEREREDRVRAEARMREVEERRARAAAASNDPRAAAAAERERMAAAAAAARARRLEASEAKDGPAPRPAHPAADRGRLARRELLPDIEEINSSLRPDTDRPAVDRARQSVQPARRKGGFGISFVATVLILLVPLAIYALAEPIARAIPDATSILDGYVAQVDGLRIALDRWASDLADRIAPGG